ncbi:deoxyribonuclease gamma isoform X3 [Eptesicus fuscus]|uniref:deoxyribonuclease gamma isoform X3 n=1 Tax=Eptesicus fuscus TaxID=29078 RepID=UPI002403E009|nr:deoxyribonuclease gamma isoform X3 [Eptesicus fuscus]
MSQPLAALLLLLAINGALALKICSFNIRSFGESKRENQKVMDVIVKIIKRCDIILLMEIKDSTNKICPTLMERLNGNSRATTYNCVISSRLGRNTYKEQYAFIYKEKLVTVKKKYLYHDLQDGDTDVFSREPFVVWFQSPQTAVKDFVIVPLHTTPEASVKEIDELADVYKDVKGRWKAETRFPQEYISNFRTVGGRELCPGCQIHHPPSFFLLGNKRCCFIHMFEPERKDAREPISSLLSSPPSPA